VQTPLRGRPIRSQGYTRKRVSFTKKCPHSLSYFQITARLSERHPLHPSSTLRCPHRSPTAGARAALLRLGGQSLCCPFACSHLTSYLNILPCVCSSAFISLSSPYFYSSSPPLLLLSLSPLVFVSHCCSSRLVDCCCPVLDEGSGCCEVHHLAKVR
jgi:hypothetical protein